MYLIEMWASLRRRWYILVPLLVAAVGLSVLSAVRLGPTYESSASVVLIPPRSATQPNLNRFLDLGSLSDSVDVLARSMGSASTSEALEREAPSATYAVERDSATGAPILLVTASSAEKDQAQRMLEAVLERLPEVLDDLQSEVGVVDKYRITMLIVSQDPEPIASQKSRIRLLAVVIAGLLLASVLLVAAIDSLLLRRAGRRRPTAAATAAAATAATAKAATGKPTAKPGAKPAAQKPSTKTSPKKSPAKAASEGGSADSGGQSATAKPSSQRRRRGRSR